VYATHVDASMDSSLCQIVTTTIGPMLHTVL
jgi:hypothetical protein